MPGYVALMGALHISRSNLKLEGAQSSIKFRLNFPGGFARPANLYLFRISVVFNVIEAHAPCHTTTVMSNVESCCTPAHHRIRPL